MVQVQVRAFPFLLAALVSSVGLAETSARDIAFCYALDADLGALVKDLGLTHTGDIKAGATTIGSYAKNGLEVHAVKMGSGCARTAASAASLLAAKPADILFSVGPVGVIGETLEVGQWALVERIVPYQKTLRPDAIPRERAPIPAGTLPLVEVPGAPTRISVASGEVFISSDEDRALLRGSTGCDAVDMNLFGLAKALEGRRTKAVHLRVASDRADADAGEAFKAFVAAYDGAGGRMVAAAVRALPRDASSPGSYPHLRKLLELDDAAGE